MDAPPTLPTGPSALVTYEYGFVACFHGGPFVTSFVGNILIILSRDMSKGFTLDAKKNGHACKGSLQNPSWEKTSHARVTVFTQS